MIGAARNATSTASPKTPAGPAFQSDSSKPPKVRSQNQKADTSTKMVNATPTVPNSSSPISAAENRSRRRSLAQRSCRTNASDRGRRSGTRMASDNMK